MIRNLGQALSVLVAQEAAEVAAHSDVTAYGAPSECHDLVSRHMKRRRARAVQRAEEIAGAPLKEIKEQAEERGFPLYGPHYVRAVDRIMAREGSHQ